MRPEWFALPGPEGDDSAPALPWDKMWESDHNWLPLLLKNIPFAGRADFIMSDGKSLPVKWWFGIQGKDGSGASSVS
jgi:8-oxo-dGTP diphosphatase / 2-hydroxy-dATP diphosphatase